MTRSCDACGELFGRRLQLPTIRSLKRPSRRPDYSPLLLPLQREATNLELEDEAERRRGTELKNLIEWEAYHTHCS